MDLSRLIDSIKAALAAHPGIVAWVVATVVAIYRSRTPAQWLALGERTPRVQGLLKAARALGIDPARAVEALAQVVTGKRVPDPRELVIASQAQRIADLERALDSYRQGVAPGFDPGARQTIALDVVAEAQRITRDGQPGYATVRALLAVVVTLAVGVPVGAIVAGCPNWNRPACPTPGVYSCVRNQPHYCGTSRELTPMGDEPCDRTGRVCAIDPDGTGTCIAAVDGGAQ